MAKLITVQFCVPDGDPASTMQGMVGTIQDEMYDNAGMEGTFKVVSITEYEGDPLLFLAKEEN